MLGGAIRVSTPFMFVALGECLTEKSGRVNLGQEGTLVLGAMVAYAASYHTGSPWIGVFAAGVAGSVLGAMHGYICKLPQGQRRRGRHRDDAVRHRRRVLLRQALHPADCATPVLPAVRRLDHRPQPPKRARHQPAVLRRDRHRHRDGLGAAQHPVGPGRAHGRRQRGGGASDGHFGRSRALPRHDVRRLPRRRSAAPSCRCPIPARGTRACRRARG